MILLIESNGQIARVKTNTVQHPYIGFSSHLLAKKCFATLGISEQENHLVRFGFNFPFGYHPIALFSPQPNPSFKRDA